MDINEYNIVKDYTYDQYCDYLKQKYGEVGHDYMRISKNTGKLYKCSYTATRTKEGLYIHHIRENTAPLLCNVQTAGRFPIEWQQKENLVYCDLLEHMFLHFLICDTAFKLEKDEAHIKRMKERDSQFIIEPELPYDLPVMIYSGWTYHLLPRLEDCFLGKEPELGWEKPCYEKVRNDKDVFLAIKDRESLKKILICIEKQKKKNEEFRKAIKARDIELQNKRRTVRKKTIGESFGEALGKTLEKILVKY